MQNLKVTKAQSSLELLIMVSGALFLFISFLYVIQGNIGDKINEKNVLEVNELASQVQDEISIASQSSEGYSRNFILPSTVANRDYTILLSENLLYIKTNDNKIAFAIPIFNVTGSIVKGTNTIRKQNNTLYINI